MRKVNTQVYASAARTATPTAAEHTTTGDIAHICYLREIVQGVGMNEKRAAYIFEKWESKGWLECGVSVMAGWLADKGMAVNAND